MVSLLSINNFKEKALYHSACIANYMLNWKKEPGPDASHESEHDVAFKRLTESLNDDLFEKKKGIFDVVFARNVMFLSSRRNWKQLYNCKTEAQTRKSLW